MSDDNDDDGDDIDKDDDDIDETLVSSSSLILTQECRPSSRPISIYCQGCTGKMLLMHHLKNVIINPDHPKICCHQRENLMKVARNCGFSSN